MGIGAVNNRLYDFSYLTEAIDRSVANIKARSATPSETQAAAPNDNAAASSAGWSMSGFSVSYLEPNALYSLQRMVSEVPEDDQRASKQAKAYVRSEEDNAANQARIGDVAFAEELGEIFSTADYAKVSAVYQQNIGFSLPQLKVIFSGNPVAENPSQYAADAYNHSLSLNQEPTVLLDFLHANNRNFDFSI